MGAFIAKQPNGLLCRHSTIVDCVTDYNMTEKDYINLCLEKALREANEVLDGYIKPFDFVKEYFSPNNMTQEEFERILQEMNLPKEQCKHIKT